jgi:alpha-L-arabinofuranosidase
MRVDGDNPKSTLMGTVKQVKIDKQDALNADIEIDGKKASIEELSLIQHSDIESMQIFEKDEQHPKVRLIITTKKNK